MKTVALVHSHSCEQPRRNSSAFLQIRFQKLHKTSGCDLRKTSQKNIYSVSACHFSVLFKDAAMRMKGDSTTSATEKPELSKGYNKFENIMTFSRS